MKITILVDNKDSWFMPYARYLRDSFQKLDFETELIDDSQCAVGGDICFLLSCTKKVGKDFLDKFSHNIVIHASDLPKGKGFTPLKWSILKGENHIVLTLFEAVEELDAGDYYFKEKIVFEGHELLGELQKTMALKICEMAIKYANNYLMYSPIKQEGEESYLPRRTNDDDRIDVKKSIEEQFNLFRIADNDRFPLWFEHAGHKYYLKIYKDK